MKGDVQKRNRLTLFWLMVVFGFFVLSSLSFLVPFFSQLRAADVPYIITYQGKLLENNASVTTTKSMGFLLFDQHDTLVYTAGGSLGATTTVSVTPSSGVFAVNLGGTGTNTLAPSIFASSSELYLEVHVGAQKLLPRKRLTSVPYALNARYLMGVTAETSSTSTYIPISDTQGRFTFATTTFTGDVTVNSMVDVPGNILSPQTKGSLTNNTYFANPSEMKVLGDYVYIAGRSGNSYEATNNTSYFSIVDISDKENPILKDTISFANDDIRGFAIQNNFAYVLNDDEAYSGDVSLTVLDIANKSGVQTVTTTVLMSNNIRANGISVYGDYAYIVNSTATGKELVVLNISAPNNPTVVSLGSADVPNDIYTQGVLDGGYFYVARSASGYDGGLTVFSVVEPGSPTLLNELESAVYQNFNSIVIRKSKLYTLKGDIGDKLTYYGGVITNDPTAGDLFIFDISNATSPTQVGRISSTTAAIAGATDLFVADRYAYITASSSDALSIIDISSSTAPVQTASITSATLPNFDAPSEVEVVGNYAYVLASHSKTLHVIDVAGAKISNAEIGNAQVGNLSVDGEAQFGGAVSIENGLSIGNNGLLVGGDFGMFSPTSTQSVNNTLRFSTSTLFRSNADSKNVFTFDAVNDSLTSASSTYLFSVRNNGTSQFSVSSNGMLHAKGTIYGDSINVATPGAPGDLAETVDVNPAENVLPGDVMVVDVESIDRYAKSKETYQQSVAGVISTKPTIVVGSGSTTSTAVMALIGRVPVNVSTENGPIQAGDLLVTASLPGHAMRYDATKDDGGKIVSIVGVALESTEDPTGQIMVLLKSGWVNNRQQTIAKIQQDLLHVAQSEGVVLNNNTTNLTVEANLQGEILPIGQNLNMSGFSIVNIASLHGAGGAWSIDSNGRFVTRVETSTGGKNMYAMQSPNSEFVFSGSGNLVNGVGQVVFDAETQELIDTEEPMKVNITLTAPAGGVFVHQKSAAGFTVKELGAGLSDATFDWVVIATRNTQVGEVPYAPEPEEASSSVGWSTEVPSSYSSPQNNSPEPVAVSSPGDSTDTVEVEEEVVTNTVSTSTLSDTVLEVGVDEDLVDDVVVPVETTDLEVVEEGVGVPEMNILVDGEEVGESVLEAVVDVVESQELGDTGEGGSVESVEVEKVSPEVIESVDPLVTEESAIDTSSVPVEPVVPDPPAVADPVVAQAIETPAASEVVSVQGGEQGGE